MFGRLQNGCEGSHERINERSAENIFKLLVIELLVLLVPAMKRLPVRERKEEET